MTKEEARAILVQNSAVEKTVMCETPDTFIVQFTEHSTDEGYMEQYQEAVIVALESFMAGDCK